MYKGVLFPFGDEAGRCILEWLMCPAVSLCCPVLLDNNLDNKLEYFKNNVLKVVEIDCFEGKTVICGAENLPRSKWCSKSQRFDPTYLHKKLEKVKK